MSPLRPRRFVHRGTVLARGVVFDAGVLGEGEARARVVAAWTPGTTIGRAGARYVVVGAIDRAVDADALGGAPLVAFGDLLAAAPLDDDARRALDPPPGAVVLVDAGAFVVLSRPAIDAVDPSTWLDLTLFEVVDVEPLGDPPVLAVAPPAPEARAVLGVAAPPPEREAAIRAWRGEPTDAVGGRAVGASRARPLLGLLALVVNLVAPRLAPSTASPPSTGLATTKGPASRFRDWLNRLAVRFLVATHLARLVGERHAEYLRETLDLFDRGDFDEALRRAIPLGRHDGTEPARVALSLPTARRDVAIDPHVRVATSVVPTAESAQQHLRATYRRAFERLVALGRFEEAAFVLAELLQSALEAVSFLESHGKARLAAEVAEARKLAPGLVVRQWVVAGDVARAVDIAQRTGALADAIARLEASRHDARALRVTFAERLASAGDYGAAVDVVWPVVEARALATRWIDLAIEGGGPGGAAALVRKALLDPAALRDVEGRARALLGDATPDPVRIAFADAVLSAGRNRALRGLARAAVRDLLAMRGASLPLRRRMIDGLAALAGDDTLRADLPLPSPPDRPAFGAQGSVRIHRFEAAPSGAPLAVDAVRLPDGRTLVAFGEAGTRLLASDGRVVAHFDAPAGALVVSDRGDRALALARRGEATRITRLDLVQRRARHWCDAPITQHAPTFDGSQWFVARQDTVLAIDALDDGFRATWSVRADDDGDQVAAIARTRDRLVFHVAGFSSQVWSYELPSLTLRARVPWASPPGNVIVVVAIAPPTTVGGLLLSSSPGENGEVSPKTLLHVEEIGRPGSQLVVSPDARLLAIEPRWVAHVEPYEGGAVCLLRARHSLDVALRLEIDHAERLAPRFFHDTLTVVDGHGVTHVDLTTGDAARVPLGRAMR